jgi:hypothetical protein
MLDPEEATSYEVWKQSKLVDSIDLSVAAYNREMEAAALAWEEGVRYGVDPDNAPMTKMGIRANNPYRGNGMRAEVR